ncbi:hypothetical protein H696_06376 [Fonticula alba]|uniref:Uncharacterized protein n=1 Tax=Fonticula alba TaxID=691883 RepID=A0A058YYY4_FONAL|nr:hypothetical protein H696_06376 [Fonticula alba]KCV67204.1 hypothetical protein H696_06376 [Fonticula alba]|eukprot:XP_009498391.1 hypothetical protein H696_06376 [Fonticula alba]
MSRNHSTGRPGPDVLRASGPSSGARSVSHGSHTHGQTVHGHHSTRGYSTNASGQRVTHFTNVQYQQSPQGQYSGHAQRGTHVSGAARASVQHYTMSPQGHLGQARSGAGRK